MPANVWGGATTSPCGPGLPAHAAWLGGPATVEMIRIKKMLIRKNLGKRVWFISFTPY
jgi:hypothetical protein